MDCFVASLLATTIVGFGIRDLEISTDDFAMHHARRADEKRPRQSAPYLESGGFAEGYMPGDAVPTDEKPILCGVFYDPFKRHAVAARCRLEGGGSLGNSGFEGGGVGGVDSEGGDFGYHIA
jgi:hypothetical protein